MKLYSYIVNHDTGFSPNPFWGYCTLADCKPTIRRTAEVGDWIVGLSPKATGNRVIFAMEVEEIIKFEQYYRDKRFTYKIPDYTKGEVIYKTGDNIYKPLGIGPGLLESVYQKCLSYELATAGHDVDCESPIPIQYGKIKIDMGFRSDMIVDKHVIIENKTVDKIAPIHEAQLLTYLKITGLQLGFLLNWNLTLMKDGIKRMISTGISRPISPFPFVCFSVDIFSIDSQFKFFLILKIR